MKKLFLTPAGRLICWGLAVLLTTSCLEAAEKNSGFQRGIPVILDADIGDDIDDTWALGLLLKSPELDLKLAVGDYGQPQYRARLLAKLLEAANRTDVRVGVGLEVESRSSGRQRAWAKDYDLKSYPGKIQAQRVCMKVTGGRNNRANADLAGHLPSDFLESTA